MIIVVYPTFLLNTDIEIANQILILKRVFEKQCILLKASMAISVEIPISRRKLEMNCYLNH